MSEDVLEIFKLLDFDGSKTIDGIKSLWLDLCPVVCSYMLDKGESRFVKTFTSAANPLDVTFFE